MVMAKDKINNGSYFKSNKNLLVNYKIYALKLFRICSKKLLSLKKKKKTLAKRLKRNLTKHFLTHISELLIKKVKV